MGGRGARSGAPRGRGVSAAGLGGAIGAGGAGAAPTPPVGTLQNPVPNGFSGVKNGTDLTGGSTLPSTVQSRTPQAIMDAMDAQGFRGRPKVVTDQAEFDKAVQAAWGGQGLEVVRGIGAPDDTTLAAYRDTLTDGDWYVSCGGGAAHGFGQYGAYRYGGKVQKSDVDEAKSYARWNGGPSTHVYHYTLDPSAKIGEESKLKADMQAHNAQALQSSGVVNTISASLSSRKRVTAGEQAALRDIKAGRIGRRSTYVRGAASYNKIMDRATSILKSSGQTVFADTGVYAAARGYDFYYDRRSGYSVTLNRTKLIVLKDW